VKIISYKILPPPRKGKVDADTTEAVVPDDLKGKDLTKKQQNNNYSPWSMDESEHGMSFDFRLEGRELGCHLFVFFVTVGAVNLIMYCKYIAVCYHENWCTKNKRMIRIPTRGLFLSCTENSFLFCTHIQ
jgi:hypothetical protein